MKVAIVSSLEPRQTRLGVLENNSKLSGPLGICQMVREIGGEATTIDYFDKWDLEALAAGLIKWFDNDPHCMIGTSGSVNDGNTVLFARLARIVKQQLPQLKVMLGGYRVITGNASWVDISFIGRCKNIVRDWLLGKDISEFQISDNPPTYRNAYNSIREDPVSPIMVPEDFGSEAEIITIETSLGCKFNCAFCGFDYRNNRHPVINQLDKLIESCQTAYDLFGMTKFFLADDTINEVNTKLELLTQLSNELSFTPEFMAFARLDVMGAKPEQVELMQKANIRTLFFGVESLNPAVTKSIRKGGKPEKNYDIMRMMKREFPEAFTYGNFIIGLAGDNEQDIWRHMHNIADEQLLTSAGCNPLRVYPGLDNWENMSEIDRNPEKFGYNLQSGTNFAGQFGYDATNWINDWTDYQQAGALSGKVDQFLSDNLQSSYTAHEYLSVKTLLPDLNTTNYNSLLGLANRKANSVQRQYISKKTSWLMGQDKY